MANGRTPDVDKGSSDGFVLEVKKRLELFCRHMDLQRADAAHARAKEIKLAVEKQEVIDYERMLGAALAVLVVARP